MPLLFPHHLFLGRKEKKKIVSNVSEITEREVARKHQKQGRGSMQAHRERENVSIAMLWQSQLSKDLSTENCCCQFRYIFCSAIPMDLYAIAVNNSDTTFPKPSKLNTHPQRRINSLGIT